MNRLVTRGIVLSRTNFGEADRILTVLTPDYGKLSMIAKGVRRVKSKLAGGIELFCVSQITFIKGRGEVGTLVSSRLETHYSSIIKSLDRVQLGYDFLKTINKNTEDNVESSYFELLVAAFSSLNNSDLSLDLVRLQFQAGLLILAGHSPNLTRDTDGHPLVPDKKYSFDVSAAGFSVESGGRYSAREIKFLRLAFGGNPAKALARVEDAEVLTKACLPLAIAMLRQYLRI